MLVGPGELYDAIWTARSPGKWLIHCHINHVTNGGVEVRAGVTMTTDVVA